MSKAPAEPEPELLIVAGEASGDLHAARLLSELVARRPELRAYGLGGEELEAAGCRRLADSSEISVVGITEVLKILARAREIFARILEEVDTKGTRAAVLVDFPEFNLRLARKLRQRGLEVVYYISPQVWAWRKRRVRTIARDVDLMLTLFPFEVDFYRGYGVEARHVGHPLVDEVPALAHVWDAAPPSPEDPFTVALLPGSRKSEVRALLPTMLATVREMAKSKPIVVRLIQAPTVPQELVDELSQGLFVEANGNSKPRTSGEGADTGGGAELGNSTSARGETDGSQVYERVTTNRFEAVASSHLALCASGTATLEVALLGTPMLVLYRLKWTSYVLAKLLVDLPYFSMPNLVLGKEVAPELLQDQADPAKVAKKALALLEDRSAIETMRAGMAELRPALGESGASGRAAQAVLERLDAPGLYGAAPGDARSVEGDR